MLQWIRKLLGIKQLQADIESVKQMIGDRTTVHCDVHSRSPSEVIVIGNYRGKDYVRCFHIHHETLGGLIDELHRLEKFSRVGRFDMIGSMPFSAVYDHTKF